MSFDNQNTLNGQRRKYDFMINILKHTCVIFAFLMVWEWAATHDWVDVSFTGQPSGIALYLWNNMVSHPTIWVGLGWTLLATFASFLLGTVTAVFLGLLFVAMPRFERFADPYVSALNAMPRIALMPLFILWFGLGIGSKVAIGFSLTFFIVLSSTVAGIRDVDQDHLTLSRTLGAKPLQIFRLVTLPGAVPILFSGMRLGLLYAMLGVVAGEIIASTHGLGQTLSFLGATFNMNGVMGVTLILALLGMLVARAMTLLERRLLRWQ